MKHLIFNNNYVLKPDNGCTLMMARYVGRNLLVGKEDSFNSVIHPIFAMILSFMNGRDYQSCICDAAAYLHVNTELIENFVLKLRKFKIELQFSVSDIDLNNLYLKTPRG